MWLEIIVSANIAFLVWAVISRHQFYTVLNLAVLGLLFLTTHILHQPSGGYTVLLPSLVLLALLHALWARISSKSSFHRQFSIVTALSCLLLPWAATAHLPFSVYGILLSVLVFVDLSALVALSPIFPRHKSSDADYSPIEIFGPDRSSVEGSDDSQETFCVDIVAVHGLASNPKTAFQSREAPHQDQPESPPQPMWLRDFLPNEGLNARVMKFNHNTSWESHALSKSLSHHGDDLLRALGRHRQKPEEQRRPIIFIGHSFGGLIIKEAVVNASRVDAEELFCEIRDSIRGFIFLGTPHKGAHLTTVGRTIALLGHWSGSSTTLLDVNDPKSTHNKELHHNFMGFVQSKYGMVKILCAFEAVRESVFGFPLTHVVDEASAVIDGYPRISIEKTHQNIHRISNRESHYYQDILDCIRRWVQNIEKSVPKQETGERRQKTSEEQECLRSLAFQEIDWRAHEIQEAASKTCSWLLAHEDYKRWRGQERGLLWIKGNPGAGKSTLMKHALGEMERSSASSKEHVLASYFFHGRGTSIQKSPLGLFRSLLHQILNQIPELLSDFTAVFQKKCISLGKPGTKWQWQEAELRHHFKNFACRKGYLVRLYIDALDEGGQDVARECVDYFQSLLSESNTTEAALGICFSCRHYPVLDLEQGMTICVEHQNKEDIATYVGSKIKGRISNEQRAQDLESAIIHKAAGVFQWVVLVIEILLKRERGGTNTKTLLKELEKIPKELDDLYQDILENLDKEDVSQSLVLMQWVSFAVEPPSLEQLRLAMVVHVDTTYRSLAECRESEHFMETVEDMERRVNNLSGGLVEIKGEEEKRSAQFIHQSVSDYVRDNGLRRLENRQQKHDFPNASVMGRAHFQLSRSCIRYLTMEDVIDKAEGVLFTNGHPRYSRWDKANVKAILRKELTHTLASLKYAYRYWALHARAVEDAEIPQGDLLALWQWPVPSQFQRSIRIFGRSFGNNDPWNGLTTLLHSASYHGLLSAIPAMLNSNSVNETDPDFGLTPLHNAVWGKQVAVLELLLAQDNIKADARDWIGRTPLGLAASCGQRSILELLAARDDVDVNSRDDEGQTPLASAATLTNEIEMAKHFLARNDVNKNTRNFDGESPLGTTSNHRLDELLQSFYNIEPNPRDFNSRTPLASAADSDQAEVVRQLLKYDDVEKNPRDYKGRTPLSLAADSGRAEVVRQLLKYDDIEKNSRDYKGRTSLSLAADSDQAEVVRQLLKYDDIEKNSRDYEGRTPLSLAADSGWAEVIRQLLKYDDVEKNSRDCEGRTPLASAADLGRAEAFRQLLDCDDIEKNPRDCEGRTPLALAVYFDQTEAVRQLLDCDDVEKNPRDYEGRTPLALASIYSDETETVTQLLEYDDVEKNLKDYEDQTPLALAAYSGQTDAVRQLLKYDDVEKNPRDYEGRTPLALAVLRFHEMISKLEIALSDLGINHEIHVLNSDDMECAQDLQRTVRLLVSHTSVEKQSVSKQFGERLDRVIRNDNAASYPLGEFYDFNRTHNTIPAPEMEAPLGNRHRTNSEEKEEEEGGSNIRREDEDVRWKDEHLRWNGDVTRWKDEDTRWKDEDTMWKDENVIWECDTARWEDEDARLIAEHDYWRVMDARWKERDARWKERDARWKERDARWKERDARWKEMDARWKERDAACREWDAIWKDRDNRRKGEDDRWTHDEEQDAEEEPEEEEEKEKEKEKEDEETKEKRRKEEEMADL